MLCSGAAPAAIPGVDRGHLVHSVWLGS